MAAQLNELLFLRKKTWTAPNLFCLHVFFARCSRIKKWTYQKFPRTIIYCPGTIRTSCTGHLSWIVICLRNNSKKVKSLSVIILAAQCYAVTFWSLAFLSSVICTPPYVYKPSISNKPISPPARIKIGILRSISNFSAISFKLVALRTGSRFGKRSIEPHSNSTSTCWFPCLPSYQILTDYST